MTGIQIALSTVVLSATVVVAATENELTWNENYGMAKTSAQAAQRPLVVVIENPTVSGEKLDDEQMSAEDRLKIQQRNFELCRVDVSTKYGKLVAEAFGAKKFPFTAVSSQNSKSIVFRKAGQMKTADWTVAIAKSTTATNSSIAPTAYIVNDYGVPVSGGQMFLQPSLSAARCFT